jgi:serine/threonine-protein phosphatase 2B regulatory subunit
VRRILEDKYLGGMGCVWSRGIALPEYATPPNSPSPRISRLSHDTNDCLEACDIGALSDRTNFSRSEITSLWELYHKLSNELHVDGLIHKDELAWALFKSHRDNLFVDRVFELFDIKGNNVIEFDEFVLSLSVFHPNAPLEEKARFAFTIYDINQSGAIEPTELKRFLVAIMADNPDVHLDDDALDKIVVDTFKQVDVTGDGKINPEEWMALVKKNPSIIRYMTLPVLADICQKFPPSPGMRRQR